MKYNLVNLGFPTFTRSPVLFIYVIILSSLTLFSIHEIERGERESSDHEESLVFVIKIEGEYDR